MPLKCLEWASLCELDCLPLGKESKHLCSLVAVETYQPVFLRIQNSLLLAVMTQ
jgi:hypothetical protein